jgi:acylphosphatase
VHFVVNAARVIVRGHVQGVGFRWFVRTQAEDAGVAGWVRNLDDGSVEAQLEGAPAALERVIEALRRGPAGARVLSVERAPAAAERTTGFRIAR